VLSVARGWQADQGHIPGQFGLHAWLLSRVCAALHSWVLRQLFYEFILDYMTAGEVWEGGESAAFQTGKRLVA
jgi:hypothetical protein